MSTFNFCPERLIVLPSSLGERVFSRPAEEDEVFTYVYQYFRDFDISFPLFGFEANLLSIMLVALS